MPHKTVTHSTHTHASPQPGVNYYQKKLIHLPGKKNVFLTSLLDILNITCALLPDYIKEKYIPPIKFTFHICEKGSHYFWFTDRKSQITSQNCSKMWHHHCGVVVTSSLIQMDGLYDKYGLHVYPSLCVHICERMKITQRDIKMTCIITALLLDISGNIEQYNKISVFHSEY